jgi:hypothetical protein
MISQAVDLLLLVSSKLLQLLERNLVQSLLVRRVQENLRNNLRTLWVRLIRIERLSPSIRKKSVSRSTRHACKAFKLTC